MMLPHLTRFSSGVALCLAAAALSFTSAQAESLSQWTSTAGSNNSNLNTNSPVIGNGNAGTGTNSQIYSSFQKQTLNNVGESLTFSASATFTGVTASGADQFRFGVYDSNGSTNGNGWLGYFGTNSGASGGDTRGKLWERVAGNTTNFGSSANFGNPAVPSAASVAYAGPTPANAVIGDGDYDFTMVLTRTDTGLKIDWSIISSSYSLTGSYLDTTALTYGFDRVGFFVGGGFVSSQIAFSDVSIEFSPAIPEPATTALIGAALVLGVSMIVRRRRRG